MHDPAGVILEKSSRELLEWKRLRGARPAPGATTVGPRSVMTNCSNAGGRACRGYSEMWEQPLQGRHWRQFSRIIL